VGIFGSHLKIFQLEKQGNHGIVVFLKEYIGFTSLLLAVGQLRTESQILTNFSMKDKGLGGTRVPLFTNNVT
jgi:hypothetical protein